MGHSKKVLKTKVNEETNWDWSFIKRLRYNTFISFCHRGKKIFLSLYFQQSIPSPVQRLLESTHSTHDFWIFPFLLSSLFLFGLWRHTIDWFRAYSSSSSLQEIPRIFSILVACQTEKLMFLSTYKSDHESVKGGFCWD